MGRALCCEKMGLQRGPWTQKEDQILISYINTYGHANWRALPKLAGLLRCGKSCRLRWINYLRPDIKRGNLTTEEEDTIISLHQMLGNRWSAIAAKLPGRTDNEIKNVWHTHLKKRLPQNYQQSHNSKRTKKQPKLDVDASKSSQDDHPVNNFPIHASTKEENTEDMMPPSPAQCSSDMSSLTTSDKNSGINNTNNTNNNNNDMAIYVNNINTPENDNNLALLDEDFWSEMLSSDNSSEASEFATIDYEQFQPLVIEEGVLIDSSSSMSDGMDFWSNVYANAEEFTHLLEL